MDADHIDALRRAAADGIDFDGFEVRAEGDRYVLRVEDGAETVVGRDDLPAVAEEYADHVTDWYFWTRLTPEKPSRRAFLRWLEDDVDGSGVLDRYDALEDGHTCEWGQLAVTVSLDREDGIRSYDLRHVGDLGADLEDLAVHDDPLDVRELVKYDGRGRYRPLKTAPTLPDGWAFPDLRAEDLIRAVDFAYPATIENWYRERQGELDVSHWRETIDRQTGIYGVVETWDRGEGHEHVNRVTEACCVDSQCLKRREWEYDGETDLDVDGGDGEFPCREPCSLVIAAARKWTRLDGEESRTYEFELTESERAQIEAIIDAVAEGRTGEIREADFDDPANRYRARYLRAKRFDGDGPGGVPTETPGSDASDGS